MLTALVDDQEMVLSPTPHSTDDGASTPHQARSPAAIFKITEEEDDDDGSGSEAPPTAPPRSHYPDVTTPPARTPPAKTKTAASRAGAVRVILADEPVDAVSPEELGAFQPVSEFRNSLKGRGGGR